MKNKFWILVIGFLIYTMADVDAMERRQDQFPADSAYLLLPLPYSIPGVGGGLLLSAVGANLFDTYTDVFAMAVTGDASGYVFGVHDFHLINETLFFDYHSEIIDKASIQSFDDRGMDSGKDDYNYYELNKWDLRIYELRLSFFERRFELYGGLETTSIAVDKIRNPDEDVVSDFEDPVETKSEKQFGGLLIDYTDDFSDAKKGVRFEAVRESEAPETSEDADFFVMNYSLSGYLPLGDSFVIAANFQKSDAFILSKGETDPEAVREELGLDCDSYANCKSEDQKMVDNRIAERKYGTAKTLGGESLMRAYPDGRFTGAHMNYFSTELRWYFKDEVTPFDFWIWKDISTSIQLAMFYEQASVADLTEELNKKTATDIGLGLRMVAASGFVYRADYATSEENQALTIMVMYPW